MEHHNGADSSVHTTRKRPALLLIANIAGAILSAIASIAGERFLRLLIALNVWAVTAAALFIAVTLYLIRQHLRLPYGIAEFVFGLVTILRSFQPYSNYAGVGAGQWLQVIGGLYIMVRGLDNIGIGIQTTTYARLWNRYFRVPIKTVNTT